MWELRWILVVLGVVLLVGLYGWTRFGGSRVLGSVVRRSRVESSISDVEGPESAAAESAEEPRDEPAHSAPARTPRRAPEKIVAVRLVPRSEELSSERAVHALREAGLRHGRYGIFHRLVGEGSDEALFSVANLLEPGSFDLADLGEKSIPGMSVFMVLPGDGDPVARFDAMVEAARTLALELDAELFDERGSSWSIQRERYVREEIIKYRHQLARL